MRKVILNIMLVLVTLDTTSLCQFFKLPSLVRHFTEHKSLNRDIDFIDFLAMHYWGEDLDDDDDEKDMQLPFKKIDLQQSVFLYVSPVTSYIFKRVSWLNKPDYTPVRSQIAYNTLLDSLFRPPRVS
jgi:hypothetical protein